MITECPHGCRHVDRIDTPAKAGGPLPLYRIRLADKWLEKVRRTAAKSLEQQYNEAADFLEEGHGLARVRRELIPRWRKRGRRRRLPILLRVARDGYEAAEDDEEAEEGKGLEESIPQDLFTQRVRPNVDEYVQQTIEFETETTAKHAAEALEEGRQEGWTTDEIARALRGTADSMKPSRASMISRTSTIWANNEGAVRRYQDNGYQKMKWIVTEDDLTCPLCLTQDGTVIAVGGTFADAGDTVVGTDGSEYETSFAVGHPPLHANCRCTVIPVAG